MKPNTKGLSKREDNIKPTLQVVLVLGGAAKRHGQNPTPSECTVPLAHKG